MTKLNTIVAATWLAAGACGCQCCCVTEYWNDLVDCTADVEPCVDCLYDPWLDLTRINRVDGLQCGCHRCQTCYVPGPVYAHRWGDPKGESEIDEALGPSYETAPTVPPEPTPSLSPVPTPAPEPPPQLPPADPFAPPPAAEADPLPMGPALNDGSLPVITPAQSVARPVSAQGDLPPLALPLFYE